MTRVLLYSATSRREPGGVQAVVSGLADALRADGHAVTEGWGGAAPVPRVDGAREWILPLDVTTGTSGRPALSAVPRATAALVRLATGLARVRPRIVNVHFVTGQALYFLALRRLMGFRVVLSVHGSDVLRPSASCRGYLPAFLRRADAITVVSDDLARRVLEFPGVDRRRVYVIPNGIDLGAWSGRRRVGGPPRVLAVGRLEPVKGFDVLLQSFRIVKRKLPAARLVIAGDGAERGALERLAESLGLQDCVEFARHVEQEHLGRLHSRATVFALPSRSEGMPLALLEALASGTPVVATRVGGVPDVLRATNGLSVPPEEPRALARALLRVLQQPDLAAQLSRRGRERVQAFSSKVSFAAYSDVYASLLAPVRRARPKMAASGLR